MATMLAPPTLSISGSSTVGRSDLTVSYVVLFDALDVNTDQTYHAHATVVGVDPNHDDVIWEWGIGDFHAGMAPLKGLPLARNITFSVPNTALNEDPGTQNGKPRKDRVEISSDQLKARSRSRREGFAFVALLPIHS